MNKTKLIGKLVVENASLLERIGERQEYRHDLFQEVQQLKVSLERSIAAYDKLKSEYAALQRKKEARFSYQESITDETDK